MILASAASPLAVDTTTGAFPAVISAAPAKVPFVSSVPSTRFTGLTTRFTSR